MSAIGILGGMGPQASARLYELLIEGTKVYTPAAVDEDYPEIVLLNVPVPNFISNKVKIAEALAMLINATKILEQSGCTINGIACNTVHILLPELQANTVVPFVSIPQLVADKINECEFKRVGLLATPTTLSSNLYDEAVGGNAVIIRPDNKAAKTIESYIYKQLNNPLTAKDRMGFRKLVASFKVTNNLDAIILGCTELPLIYGNTNNEEIIDTLQLLSDELLRRYYER